MQQQLTRYVSQQDRIELATFIKNSGGMTDEKFQRFKIAVGKLGLTFSDTQILRAYGDLSGIQRLIIFYQMGIIDRILIARENIVKSIASGTTDGLRDMMLNATNTIDRFWNDLVFLGITDENHLVAMRHYPEYMVQVAELSNTGLIETVRVIITNITGGHNGNR